jgi:hypothetical protein
MKRNRKRLRTRLVMQTSHSHLQAGPALMLLRQSWARPPWGVAGICEAALE